MQIQRDDWLAAIFGCEVFKVSVGPAVPDSGAADPVLREHLEDLRRAPVVYYAKVDTGRIDAVRMLGASGFYVVDVNVTFELPTKSQLCEPRSTTASHCTVREIRGAQEEKDVLTVAATSFRYSRFHLDPMVPKSIADRIKHDWVLSYLRKQRGHRLLGAFVDNRVAGFIAILDSRVNDRHARTIDLIGVSPDFQRQGVGQELMNDFMLSNKKECDILRVGTQAANLPSMRLYQKLGFAIVDTSFVLHLHRTGSMKGIGR
jgi:ribosomal protein S18 acetylase RimI-like enzyme